MEKKRHRLAWYWRWLTIAFLAFVLAVTVTWQVAQRFIDIDRYRPRIEAEMRKATGLAASIAHIELDLLPSPRVEATGVTLGEGDFGVYVPRITVCADLSEILDRRIRIPSIDVTGFIVSLPEKDADLIERIRRVGPQKKEEAPETAPAAPEPPPAPATVKSPTSKPALDLWIGYIAAQGIVRRGQAQTEWASFDVRADEPLSETVAVRLDMALAGLGKDAGLTADLQVTPKPEVSATGTVEAHGVEIAALFPDLGLPQGAGSVRVAFNAPSPGSGTLDVSGELNAPSLNSLSGTLTAAAWWDAGRAGVKEARWTSPGIEALCSMTRLEDGGMTFEAPRVAVNAEAIEALLPFLPEQVPAMQLAADAAVAAENVYWGLDKDRHWHLGQGSVQFNGVNLALDDGAVALANLRGKARVEEGLCRIEELAGDGFSVTGTLKPDFAARSAAVDLAASTQLNRAQLALFLPLDTVKELTGGVKFDRIAGTFTPDGGVPADLAVEGRVEKARVVVTTPEFSDTLAPISAHFTTDANRIQTTVTAESEQLGKLKVDGRYTFADHTWHGAVSGDVERAAQPFLSSQRTREIVGPILAAFGASVFDVDVSLPAAEARDIAIAAKRQGDGPPFDAAVRLARQEDRFALDTMTASTAIPLGTLTALVPPEVVLSGTLPLKFSRMPIEQTFALDADLTPCSIKTDHQVHKRSGDPVTVRLTGDAGEGMWAGRNVVLTYHDEMIAARIEDERLVAENVEVHLGPFAALLPDGAKASGKLKGGFSSRPLSLDMVFENAALSLSPELAIESVNGPLTVRENSVACDNLAFRGANSAGVLTAAWSKESWDAQIKADQVDVNTILAMRKTFMGEPPAETPPATVPESNGSDRSDRSVGSEESPKLAPPPAKPLPTGKLRLDVAKVMYRRAEFEEVHAAVRTGKEGVFADEISLRPHTGKVTGTIALPTPEAGAPSTVKVDFQLADVDMRILDELAFETPREFYGVLTGTVDLKVPFGPEIEPVEGANGAVAFVVKKGSFGKLGFATKVFSAIRSIDIFRLRMPSLKDEGLTYDECRGALAFENGLLYVNECVLKSSPMLMQAEGLVNFPTKGTDVQVRVSLLETITNVMDYIPGLKGAADAVNTYSSVVLFLEGSPYDMSVRIAPGERLGNFTEHLRESTKTGEKTVVNGLIDTATGTLNHLLGR